MKYSGAQRIAAGLCCLASLAGAISRAAAAPVFAAPRIVNGTLVYPDSKLSSTYYYAPGKLLIALDKDKKPDISFLQMRYTGTAATGDQGQFRTRSILSFHIQMAPSASLSSIRAGLKSQGVFVSRLKALPIRCVETMLNYIALKPDAPESTPATDKDNPLPVGAGALQAGSEAPPTDEYWSDRTFTLSPDDLTSQALWSAFQTGKVILSLSYAFIADGIPADTRPIISGNVQIPGLLDELKTNGDKTQTMPCLVLADAVIITVDAKTFADRFKQIDINDNVPANYAVLSVYCYDFNNKLRPDLFEKDIEIQATSVLRKPLFKTVRFSKTTPDVYSSAVKFQFAVLLRYPYKYRVHEINNDGEEKISSWQDGKSWSQMLDLTTPEAQRPKPKPSTLNDSIDGETP